MSKKLYFSSFAFLVLFALVVVNAKPVHAEESAVVPLMPDTALAVPDRKSVV